MSEIIRSIEQAQLRTDMPAIAIGDTVTVIIYRAGRQYSVDLILEESTN